MSRRLRLILIAATAVVILACAGGIAAVVWMVTSARQSVDARNALESYLHAIEGEKWEVAYEYLCTDYRAIWTKEAYLRLQNAPQPDWTRHDVDAMPSRHTLDGRPVWRFEVRLHAADGQTHDWVLDLIEDDGRWKVCAPDLQQPHGSPAQAY